MPEAILSVTIRAVDMKGEVVEGVDETFVYATFSVQENAPRAANSLIAVIKELRTLRNPGFEPSDETLGKWKAAIDGNTCSVCGVHVPSGYRLLCRCDGVWHPSFGSKK